MSESAFQKEITAEIHKSEQKPSDDYTGGDWWQIWKEELFIFDIEPERWPAMMTAYGAYEVFLDIVAAEDYDFTPGAVEAARLEQPELLEKEHSVAGFQEFAKLYAGLTFREAHAVFDKMDWWHVRCGITGYSDEVSGDDRSEKTDRIVE